MLMNKKLLMCLLTLLLCVSAAVAQTKIRVSPKTQL